MNTQIKRNNPGAFPKGHPQTSTALALDHLGSHSVMDAKEEEMASTDHEYRNCDFQSLPDIGDIPRLKRSGGSSYTINEFISLPPHDFNRTLVRRRNFLAHKKFEEAFQDGIQAIYETRLLDLKSFLTSKYSEASTLFTAHKVETLISTIVILSRTEDTATRFAAITLCLNSFTGRGVTERMVDFLKSNVADFIVDERLQSSGLREVLDGWDKLNDSTFIDKIRNVASYCMAFSVLETLGMPESVAEIVYAEFKVQKRTKQVTSFIHAILDAIEFTCSRIVVCVHEGSLDPLFHTTSTYTEWFDKTQKLEKWTSMLTCDPDTLDFTYQEYEKELADCIKVGQNFVKHSKSNADRKSLTVITNRLELFLADYQTKHIVGKSRIMPFGLLLFGNSSVGKSSFTDILFSFSAKVLKQKDEPEYKYTRNFRDPFWSGFKSHKWFILLDDVGSIKPSAVNGTDPSVDEIISLMNTVSLLCNMADLSEKGRVAARPLVVIATSNHPWMNVQHYAYHPSALMRRFPYRVTATVKREYQMDNAPTMLDPAKCVVDYTRSYPDFWDITVDKILATPLPSDGSQPACEPITINELRDVGMSKFLPWYKEKLIGHMDSQRLIKSKMETMARVRMCDHEIPIGNCDLCTQLQVGERTITEYWPDLSIRERIFAFFACIYFMLFCSMNKERAMINAYRRLIPVMRITNASVRAIDRMSTLNPFGGVTLQVAQLPRRSEIGAIATNFLEFALKQKKFILVSATLGVTVALIKMLRTAEALQFSFMKPTPKDEKKAAKWTNDSIHLSPLTLSRQTKSMKGLDNSQVLELISRNVIAISPYTSANTVFNNCMLALGGNIYAINSHLLDRCPDIFRMDCTFMPSAKAGTRNTSIKVDKRSIKKVLNDVTLIEINNFPPAARIDHLLVRRGFSARAHGSYISRTPEGTIRYRDAKNVACGILSILDVEGYWSDCATRAGDCGSPLICWTAYGPALMGIHSAGRVAEDRAFCSRLFKEDVEDLIMIDSGVISLQSETRKIDLFPVINRRDPVFFLDESNCAIYGTLSTGTSNMRSNVSETRVSPFFKGKGWSTTHEKPNLGTWKPWYHGMKDMAAPNLLISSASAEWLARKTLCHYFENVDTSELELIQLYDIDTAVSGADGVNYVNSLAMNTSLGFPWRKPKNEKIVFDPETGIFNLDEELITRVQTMIATYRRGERCNPIFCGSEKDEARAAEKNSQGKIRIFMGAPTDLVIVMRMFFGSLIRVVQRNPGKFECAVGINAHSKEWHNLATDLLSKGDGNLFDGDYQAYDKKMEAVLIYAVIVAVGDRIIANLTDTCGFTELELKNVYMSIASDVAFAYIDYNGTLLSFLRNHVSGEPLTVIINCFVGGCYVRHAYKESTPDDPELELFKERIVLRTYGDDNVVSVTSGYVQHFNFEVMQRALLEIGVVYTRADKQAGSYTTKFLKDVEFLKRGFVYSEALGRYTGPLAETSIQKSFLIGQCSKSITQEERDLATMNSGLREFFFHGEVKYTEMRNLILECCDSLKIDYNERNFPVYSHYLALYRENDIVHFEHLPVTKDDTTDVEFQVGDYYCQTGGGGIFIPAWIDGNFLISKNNTNDFEVTHVAFTTKQELQYFADKCNSVVGNRLKARANAQRFRVKISLRYRLSLYNKVSQKLASVISDIRNFSDIQSSVELANISNGDLWVNPPPDSEIEWMFKQHNIETSRSSITAVATNCIVEGGEDHVSHASSGDSEHYVRQDTEIFQSSEEIILSFADENKGEIGHIGTGRDKTRDTSVYKDAGISQFLQRPVLISTTTWSENANINTFIDPFFEFFNDSRIKNKVTNYSLLRCNLRVKVLINASPFYYGVAKTIWKPLPDYAPDTFIEVSGQEGWKVPFTQIPGFYINVGSNEGGEMVLPFFYHKNWLRITSAIETRNMGQLQIRSLTPLYNANSVSSSDVTLQVYAWAENVELSGPTVSEALQAGDEYNSEGPISGPASAIANAAGSLARVPLFRPYALATQMISSKLSDVARFFGFTNVANIQSEIPQHPGAFLGMSSTNLMTPYESLTIDDKNELTIDPRVAGIAPKDELMISEFCGRESWIWQSTWSSSDSVNKILFQSRVMPELIRTENSALYRQSTPMAHLNRMFGNWRGDILFRFRFICSKYHRGRVRITFDPDGDLFTNATTSTTSVTRIVDIAEESDVEMVVPYMQALSFLKTSAGVYSFVENMNGGGSALVRNSQFDNGQISVRVFTKQTSPVSDAPIIMQVFVSAPNMDFAGPIEVPKDFSIETLQSGDERSHVVTNVENNDDHMYQVHFGERITSLRQLLRRKNFYYTAQLSQGVDGDDAAVTVNKLTLPRLPVPYGYAPNGGFQSPGSLNPGNQYSANYVANTPLSLLMQCFVGVTGSMVYTINVDSPRPIGSVYASRALESYTMSNSAFKPSASSVYITSSSGTVSKKMYFGLPGGAAGRVLTNQNTQAGLTFKVPMYSNRRFLATSANNIQSNNKVDGTELDTFTVVVLTKPHEYAGIEKSTQIQYYYMAGADFNLLYFRNIPTYSVYNLPWPTLG